MQCVAHHVGEAGAVAAAVVLEALVARNVPAGSVGRRLAVDGNVAILLGQLAVLGRAEEVGGGPGAGVQDQHYGWLGLQLGRHVYEHLYARRVVAKVLHLRQGRALDELAFLTEGVASKAGQGRKARHEMAEAHDVGDVEFLLVMRLILSTRIKPFSKLFGSINSSFKYSAVGEVSGQTGSLHPAISILVTGCHPESARFSRSEHGSNLSMTYSVEIPVSPLFASSKLPSGLSTVIFAMRLSKCFCLEFCTRLNVLHFLCHGPIYISSPMNVLGDMAQQRIACGWSTFSLWESNARNHGNYFSTS